MQVKVIQDYERQMLIAKNEEQKIKKGEEHLYLGQVNAKIQQDLINVKEVFQINANESKDIKKVDGEKKHDQQSKQSNYNDDKDVKDFLQRWLGMVKDLIQS